MLLTTLCIDWWHQSACWRILSMFCLNMCLISASKVIFFAVESWSFLSFVGFKMAKCSEIKRFWQNARLKSRLLQLLIGNFAIFLIKLLISVGQLQLKPIFQGICSAFIEFLVAKRNKTVKKQHLCVLKGFFFTFVL